MTFRLIGSLRQPAKVSTCSVAMLQHYRGHFRSTALSQSRFSVGLRGERTYNLGQIEGIISNGVEDEVLESVDNVEQLLAQRGHGAGGCVAVCGRVVAPCEPYNLLLRPTD